MLLFAISITLLPIVLGLPREDVIQQAVDDMDQNNDNIITEDELHAEFVIPMDINSDWLVSESEFLNPSTGWPSFYGDSQATSEDFFENLNVHCIWWLRRLQPALSGCGFIGPRDLLQQRDNMDANGDEIVTKSELYDWMDAVRELTRTVGESDYTPAQQL